MPLGQNLNSTTVYHEGMHRGASLLSDPTIIEDASVRDYKLLSDPIGAENSNLSVNMTKVEVHDDRTLIENNNKNKNENSVQKKENVKTPEGETGKVEDKKNSDEVKADCKYFLKNNCRHGLSGKTQFEGKSECPFNHPQLCRKFINNGWNVGGCRKKDTCERKHPKICASSLRERKCIKINTNEKCVEGYHLKNTVGYNLNTQSNKEEEVKASEPSTKPANQAAVTEIPVEIETVSVERIETNNIGNSNEALRSFLGEIVKEQILIILGLKAETAKGTVDPKVSLMTLLSQTNPKM